MMFDSPDGTDGGSTTTDQTAPRQTGPITDPNDPRLKDPAYASDPEVLKFLSGIYGQGGTAFNPTPATPGWDPNQQGWNPGKATETGVTGGGAPPSTAGPGGSLIQPFTQPYVPAGSASANPTPLPTIEGSVATIPGAPQFPDIPRFQQPTIDEAMADPGYKFVLDQGDQNLQNWAAARGTLNDSSTAKAMIDYGQGAATTQYGNVWDRAFRTYDTNVNTQYLQPWQAKYQNWLTGTVGPTMSQYQTNAANTGHLNDVRWQDAWNAQLQSWNQFRDQRDSTFSKQYQVATA